MGDLSRREARGAFRDFIWQNVPENLRTRTWQMLESIVFSQEPILRELEYLEVRQGAGAPTPADYPDSGYGVWIDTAGSTAWVVLKWEDGFYIIGGSGAGSLPPHTHVENDITDLDHLTEGDISHLNINNIGSNTHPQIDTHIANGSIHFSTVTYKQEVCLAVYEDVKTRLKTWNLHGNLIKIVTGQPLDSVPTDIVFTNGRSKIMIVLNAGSDFDGEITVTGTSVDRNTGALTAADTDTVTVDALTTDNSDTDAQGNDRWAFVGAYLTSKWFTGLITFSTTDLTLTDVDVYQVSFEQMNDEPIVEITTVDLTAIASNTAAWFYGYLYLLEVTGDKCDITREASSELPASEVTADRSYRLRVGNLGLEFDGSHDGFWIEVFPGPLNLDYWEDLNLKVWGNITRTAVLS